MKEYKILLEMQKQEYVTAKQLSERLLVSEKTIRNSIQNMKSELERNGAQILSKSKIGYELIVFDYDAFSSFMKNCCYCEEDSSSPDRVNYILECFLLNSNKYIKLDDLAYELHVSKSCINRDIRDVKKILNDYGLNLESKPYYGLHIYGNEYNLRRCIVQYFSQLEEQSKGVSITDQSVLENIVSCTKDVLERSEYTINEFQFHSLVMHLFIAIMRIKKGNYVLIDNDKLAELKNFEEYQVAREIKKNLSDKLQIDIPDVEISYITIHLAAKRTIHNSEIQADNKIVVENRIQRVVDEILQHIYAVYNIDLRHDFELNISLMTHFVVMDIRLRYDLKMRNPLINSIKQNYQLAFIISQSCNEVIKKYYGKYLDDDELGYITLHLELAMERTGRGKKKSNVLIVCSTGQGTAQLLKYEYSKKFKEYINKIYTLDPTNLEKFNFDLVDYIFSTIEVDVPTNKPVILVNPILEKRDVEKITSFMMKESKTDCFFNEKLFFIDLKGSNPESVIKEMVSRIKEVMPLPDDFEDLILKRENLGMTSFQTGVAFPHPFIPCVDHTFVAIGILQKPVVWKENTIELVYLFALTKNVKKEDGIDDLYRLTGNLLSDRDRIKTIVQKKSFEIFKKNIFEIEMIGD